ncbi:hypothetical protein [Variovorax atrisoli]|uniref:hypothetical protein n=1 Tax=Variovorax atrisoli TaxID=3394203 RepID=UPI003394B405
MRLELSPTCTSGLAAITKVLLAAGILLGTPAWSELASAKGAGKPVDAWRKLQPESCTLLEAKDRDRLPAAWTPYLAATRRCELAAPDARPQVALVTIFASAYYEGRPANAPWERFPTPLLVDSEFRCVGGIDQLFPWDQPAMLELRHGLWMDGIPQEIRVHVDTPGVGGSYDLPTLRWNAEQRRYQAVGQAERRANPCQQP